MLSRIGVVDNVKSSGRVKKYPFSRVFHLDISRDFLLIELSSMIYAQAVRILEDVVHWHKNDHLAYLNLNKNRKEMRIVDWAEF